MGFASLVDTMDRAVQSHLGGVKFTYQPRGGVPVTGIPGVFDEVYHLEQPEHSSVEQIGPAIWVKLVDLPTDPDEDNPRIFDITSDETGVVNPNRYVIRERKTDGPQGRSIIFLLTRCD